MPTSSPLSHTWARYLESGFEAQCPQQQVGVPGCSGDLIGGGNGGHFTIWHCFKGGLFDNMYHM